MNFKPHPNQVTKRYPLRHQANEAIRKLRQRGINPSLLIDDCGTYIVKYIEQRKATR